MTVGHTKFKPDRLFASIAKTFYDRDVFCVEMLHTIAELYSVAHIFNLTNIFQWRSPLEKKYVAIPGITSLHDFIVTEEALKHRSVCYMGLYGSITVEKSGVSDHACSPESYVSCPVTLTPEKLKQLHDRFIKTSVAGYIRPPFLPLLWSANRSDTAHNVMELDMFSLEKSNTTPKSTVLLLNVKRSNSILHQMQTVHAVFLYVQCIFAALCNGIASSEGLLTN